MCSDRAEDVHGADANRLCQKKKLIVLTIDGKTCLAAGGGVKGDSSTVLIFQEQLFLSELFKDIQDAILLILHYRTMCC